MQTILPSSLKQWMHNRWVQLAMVVVVVLSVRCWPMLFQGKTLYFADNYSLLVPGKVFTAEWLRQGILPLWNPYIMAGLPWIGDVNQSVLYPSTLFFLWSSPASALNITVISHLILAAVGMYGLSFAWTKHQPGSLLAAALWASSTHVSGSINNLTTVQSIVWIPWLLWIGVSIGQDKRAPLWFALVVLLQFAGGYPQHVLYGIAMAVLFSGYRTWQLGNSSNWWRWWREWIVTAIISVMLSAIIWLPFIEVLSDSTRMVQSNAQAAVGSLHPGMLIKLVSPYFFDKSTAGMKWGPAWSGQPNVVLYVTWFGLGVIGWVVKSAKTRIRDDWFLGLFCGGTLLFALGEFLPGFEVIQTLLPLFRVSRYPSMVLMLTNIALILWVSSAWSRLILHQVWYRRIALVLGISLLGATLAAASSHWVFPSIWNLADQVLSGRLRGGQFHTLERDQVIAQAISQSWWVASALTLGALWALRKKRWWLIVLLLSLDMLYHTQAMFFFGPATVYPANDTQSPVASLIPSDPQSRWLTRNSNQPYTDYGSYWEAMVVRAPFSDSFVDATELATTAHARRLSDGLTPNWNTVNEVPTIHGYTSLVPQDFAALWERDQEVGINFIDRIELDNQLLGQWAVKYYLVDEWFTISESLPGQPIATYQQWQVYQLPALSRIRYGDDTPVELTAFSETPNQLEFSFSNASQAAQLLIADRYDENWLATVNGQPTPVEEHQGMRQIAIQAGTNSVVVKYQPQFFYWGSWISILGLGFAGGWWWWVRRQPFFSKTHN